MPHIHTPTLRALSGPRTGAMRVFAEATSNTKRTPSRASWGVTDASRQAVSIPSIPLLAPRRRSTSEHVNKRAGG